VGGMVDTQYGAPTCRWLTPLCGYCNTGTWLAISGEGGSDGKLQNSRVGNDGVISAGSSFASWTK
jgi:hypothetical protein